jgi:hypothetical protein
MVPALKMTPLICWPLAPLSVPPFMISVLFWIACVFAKFRSPAVSVVVPL